MNMDTEDLSLEEKCEHLMNVVVESRKRFGKMCIDYEQKTSLMENKMLNLQLETITNYKFKSKQQIPDIDVDSMYKDIEDVGVEIIERNKRIEDLRNGIRNTQNVVLQLKQDRIGQRLRKPVTADAMLESAKNKNCL
ncbi:uncharacterized protein [Epargyreus clarus]|uniref:uncharacterized protein n=1 Tax=Epargyreus clarus TaxID=520877 RepID=UPI003C2ED1BA